MNGWKRFSAGMLAVALLATTALPVYAQAAPTLITPAPASEPTPTATAGEQAGGSGATDQTPTAEPTAEPTAQPTVQPTVQPTAQPEPLSLSLFSLQPFAAAQAASTQTAYTISGGQKIADGITDATTVAAFKLAAIAFSLDAGGYDSSYMVGGSNNFAVSTTLRFDDNWLGSCWDAVSADNDDLESLYTAATDAENDDAKIAAYEALNKAMQDEGISGPVYEYNFGTSFTLPASALNQETEVSGTVDGVALTVGHLIYTTATDGGLQATFTFAPYILALNNVRADFESDLNLTDTLFKDSDKANITWNPDKLLLEVEGNLSKADQPTHDADFTASKTAPADTTNPYIDYEISFAVAGDTPDPRVLDGLTMVDALPAGLMVQSVSLAANGGTSAALSEGDYTQTADANGNYILNYTFPAEKNTTQAVFEVRAALTPAAYQEYMNTGAAGYSKTFTNVAELHGANNEVYKRTAPATTNMNVTFFTKDGRQNAYNGNIFDWEIDANTNFSQAVGAYLVDEIDPARHTYLTDSLKVALDGNTAQSVTLTTIDSDSDPVLGNTTYADLTNEALQATGSKLGAKLKALTTDGNAICFRTQDGKQVMVLPFDGYTNYKAVVTYSTAMVNQTIAGTETFSNQVKLIWNSFAYGAGTGTGTGQPLAWNIDISKQVTGTYDYVQKNAGVYDSATHTLGWDFKINQYRQALTNLTITEGADFAAAATDQWVYSYYKDGVLQDKANQTLPPGDSSSTEYPYYTVENETYVFHFGDLTENDYYDLHIVADATSQLATGDNAHTTLTNNASYTYDGDNAGPFNIKGSKTVENVLIDKQCTQAYDAATKTIQWQVTINTGKLALTDAVITDLLPVGNVFCSMDEVSQNGSLGSIDNDTGTYTFTTDANTVTVVRTETPSTNTDGTTQNTEKFAFVGQTQDESAYTFTFTTQMGTTTEDSAYLSALLSKNTADPIKNTAQLSGTIGNQTINDGKGTEYLAADASTPMNDKALAKSGVFNQTGDANHLAGTVTWTIVLNKGQADITGKTVVDNFALNPDPNLLQLVLQSGKNPVSVATADMGTDGSYKNQMDVTNAVTSALTADEQGFSFTVPDNDTIKNKVLIFTFDTYITDDTNLAAVTNRVQLFGDGGTDPTEDITSGGVGSVDFWLDDYAEAQVTPYVRVAKLSTSQNASGNHVLGLGGAKFTVTAYQKGDDNDTYTAAKTLSRTTRATGACNFLNLSRGVLYSIAESNPPAGYTKSDAIKWVYFLAQGETAAGPLTVDGQTDTITPVSIKLSAKAYKVVVQDTPTGVVQFTKQGADHLAMAGFTFRLVRTTDNKVAEQTAISDSNGLVEFDRVDPGTYAVYETFSDTATPAGYENISDKKLMTVAVAADKVSCQTTYKAEATDYVTVAGDGSATVTDQLIYTNVSLVKNDQNGTALPGVSFTLTGAPAAPNSGWINSVIYTTDANGALLIQALPCGEFTLTENLDSGSYTEDKTDAPATVTFTVGRDAKGNATVTRTDGETSQAITADNGTFNLGTAANTLKYGSINLTKISKEPGSTGRANGALSGVSFTITRVIDGARTNLMTLKTNGQGQFTQNENGSYTDSSGNSVFLVYGDYEIAETAAPTAHTANTTAYSFTVSDTTVGVPTVGSAAPGCVWLTDAPTNVVYNSTDKTLPADTAPATFSNTVVRRPVSVSKTGSTGGDKLPDAVFMVYEGGSLIAQLTDPDSDGEYDTLDSSITGAVTNKTIGGTAVPYVYGNQLLAGSYTLKETQAPDGYDTAADTPFAITAGTPDTGITQTVEDQPFTVCLNLHKIDQLQTTSGPIITDLNGVTFTLKGKDFNGTAYKQEQISAGAGTLTFTDLRANNKDEYYTLTEDPPIENEPDYAPEIYHIYVNKTDRSITAERWTNDEQEAADYTGGTLTVTNTRLQRSFGFTKLLKDRETDAGPAYNPNHTAPAAGVSFALYPTQDCTGTPLQTAVSDETGAVWFKNFVCGSYYFKETAAADDTVLVPDTVYEATVGTDGSVTITQGGNIYTGTEKNQRVATDLAITDDVVRGSFEMVKVSQNDPGTVLAGSTYGLFRPAYPKETTLFGLLRTAAETLLGTAQGIPAGYIEIAEATTDANGKLAFNGLLTGINYYVRELKAPSGYQVSQNPIQLNFKLEQDSAQKTATLVLGDLGGGTAYTDANGNLVWLEPMVRLGVLKTDPGSSPLAGATLALYNSEGTELTRWVSDGTEHLILGSDVLAGGETLVAGRSYTLRELAAPAGYELAAPITFVLTAQLVGPGGDYLQHLVMQDAKTPQPGSTPTPTPTPAAVIPQTGDTSNPLLYAVLLVGSAAALAGLYVGKRRRGKK